MKRKLTALLTAVMIMFTMAVPAALAEPAKIPDLANCFPEDIELAQVDEETGMRLYFADDVEALMTDVVEYLGILCTDYGFDGISSDFESSDSFVFVYLTEYSGNATPQSIMEDCPDEAYVLVALTGYEDRYLAIVVTVDGIEISDSEMPYETGNMTGGADAYDYAVLPDPGLFLGLVRGEDYEHRTDDTPMVSYLFEMTEEGEDAAFSYMQFIMEEYGYELVHTYEKDYISVTAKYFSYFYFEYTGPYDVSTMPYEEYIDDPEFGGIWNVKVSFMYDYMNGTIMLTVYFAPGISLIDSGKHTSYDIINLNNGNSSDNSSGGGGSSFDVGGRTEEECINCDGTGWRDCFTCNGKGYTGYGSDAHDCPSVTCNGGKVSCTSCGGDGRK